MLIDKEIPFYSSRNK